MADPEDIRRRFQELYGSRPRLFSAPGRVNLIGEHTDYNDGFVFPAAINRRTLVAAAVRSDRKVRVHSVEEGETLEFDLDAEPSAKENSWLNYVEGVARILEMRDVELRGADLMVQSDIPSGAGLSSSAALEIGAGLALVEVSEAQIDMVALSLAAQTAEHTFVGTRCGIMDQLSSSLGRHGHALLIDCRSLEITPIPVDTTAMALVLCDTNVKHSLASSQYNKRREECERGVAILREHLPGIRALRDVTQEEFERFADRLPEPIRSRCRHVVTENARTLAAADAMRNGDYRTMGTLMAQSHDSLRYDYEVSCPELDAMVEIARSVEGAIGARMTGGGFGGCTVNFVRRDQLGKFTDTIMREYRSRTGNEASIYTIELEDGAGEIRERGV